MKTSSLYDYQVQGVERFAEWFQDASATCEALISLTMGMGKTRTAASCIQRLFASIKPGAKVLWLTHREELIEQSKNELEDCTGQSCEVEQAKRRCSGLASIVVASVATLRGKRLQNLAADFQPDLIVCDEAHHALALSWMQIKQTFPNARILNLTATPYRSDIGNRIDLGTVLIEKNTTEGIRMGVLVPPKPVGKLELNLGSVKKRLGDYDTDSLTELLCHPDVLRASVKLLEEHARGRKTILFAASVDHGKQISAQLREIGFRVGEVYGDTPTAERQRFYCDIREGRLDVLTNNLCLTEGFNLPALDLVAMFRPTRNAALYLQCIGRGLRRDPDNPNKDHCLIIDVVDTFKRKGGKEFPLPSEDDRRIYSLLQHRHASVAEVFLSWFYRVDDLEKLVQKQVTLPQCERLDSPEKVHSVCALPWMQLSAGQTVDSRLLRVWSAEGEYSDLLQPFRLNDPEAFRLLASRKGWLYLPHNQVPKDEEALIELAAQFGCRSDADFNYTVETLISRDAQLRNFILNLFDPKQSLKEQAAKCYDLLPLCPGGPKAAWFKVIGESFHFIQWKDDSNVTRFLVRTAAGVVYAFRQDGFASVKPEPRYVFSYSDLPDFVRTVTWAKKRMSEKQAEHVCRMLSISRAEAENLRISKLSASSLMSNQWHKGRLKRIADMLRNPDALTPAAYHESVECSAEPEALRETKNHRDQLEEMFPAPVAEAF
ncbi:MAG: hypothetical protein ABS95_00180 [Verrucomicrobia bacterium SCN 57-15]|nr:MAG: hypothetical protein ABS95_00180 [Verrucomicrobia bacterium SCN 57-15]